MIIDTIILLINSGLLGFILIILYKMLILLFQTLDNKKDNLKLKKWKNRIEDYNKKFKHNVLFSFLLYSFLILVGLIFYLTNFDTDATFLRLWSSEYIPPLPFSVFFIGFNSLRLIWALEDKNSKLNKNIEKVANILTKDKNY